MDTSELNIKYDLGALSIFDSSQLEKQITDENLKALASENFTKIFNKYLSIKKTYENENEKLDDEL